MFFYELTGMIFPYLCNPWITHSPILPDSWFWILDVACFVCIIHEISVVTLLLFNSSFEMAAWNVWSLEIQDDQYIGAAICHDWHLNFICWIHSSWCFAAVPCGFGSCSFDSWVLSSCKETWPLKYWEFGWSLFGMVLSDYHSLWQCVEELELEP
jgi:hypothetical protein